MSDQDTTQKPLLERGITNLALTAIFYPMTALPFTPLVGIYRTGKTIFENLQNTKVGEKEITHITATAVATPLLMMPAMIPLGLYQGANFVSSKIAEHGIDTGVQNVVGRIFSTASSTVQKTLSRNPG